MFHSLVPQVPEFLGREVVTFHNQRDFIFFRRHRYIYLILFVRYMFESKDEVNLQEIGPRFTLKLRALQNGIYDIEKGEYEWKWHVTI